MAWKAFNDPQSRSPGEYSLLLMQVEVFTTYLGAHTVRCVTGCYRVDPGDHTHLDEEPAYLIHTVIISLYKGRALYNDLSLGKHSLKNASDSNKVD